MPRRPSAINVIWLLLVLGAFVAAAWAGSMAEVTAATFDSAQKAVELALGLVGALALWLGVVKVAERAGLMRLIARAIRPVMVRLFPEVPAEHPAMSAMVMNLSANALGLGNAATPLGLKAMTELERLNPTPGTATNAMCLFLAINTSSVTLLPVTVMSVRAAAGATSPSAIILPTLLATLVSTTVAVIAAKTLARRSALPAPAAPTPTSAPPQPEAELSAEPSAASDSDNQDATAEELVRPPLLARLLVWGAIGALLAAVPYRIALGADPSALLAEVGSTWLVPLILAAFLAHGYLKGVPVYEAVADGAREGFHIAVRIIPFLVTIFVAIGVFRASGAFDALVTTLRPAFDPVGMPPDVLPVALLRPLSGSGALGAMSDIVRTAPDSFSSYLASTMQGSTETTFYVLALYFGSVGVRRTRHALTAGLIADAAGVGAAVTICQLTF